ncbi:spermatogenesis-associated protein 6 [Gadus chalcogrammus]|uniref:spermatogenesis-associated protein 6 n=1 Tax=Gadus chalcogrammus TaxID=1042646 RepID=UPI0024C492CC|nr:spermatogenesis-associated protein 6 [Gadus chalcogrammus]
MKEPTPVKLSSCKSYQKILKCTVYLDIHSITCPGALLTRSEDIYLSVCVMGQYRKTHCMPAIFPLLFNHKMVFVRTFPGVVDPADVSEQLESDTSTLELIQMVPPEGEILATVEEGTRDFVFPGPRLTASEEAPERQILMRKSSSFPGIAPMVEFATTAVIEEMDGADSQPATPLCGLHPERSSPARPRRSPRKKTTMSPSLRSMSQPSSPATLRRTQGDPGKRSPSNRAKEKEKTGDSLVSTESPGTSPLPAPTKPVSPRRRRRGSQRTRPGRGQLRGPPRAEASPRYQQPTVASVSRALSPYTHRRMCELSEDAQARLAHLQLGPHHFRKQTLSQPPFQVPFHSDVSFSESPSYQPVSPTRDSVLHRFGSARYTADHPVIALDSSLLGSYRPELAKSQSGSTATGLSPEAQRSCRGEKGRTGTPVEKAWSIPGPSSSRSPPPLGHSSIQERLHCSPSGPSQWEQIHSRVQRILQTHGASPKRLTEEEEKEERQERSGGFCGGADCGPPVPENSDSPGGWAGGLYGSKQGSRDVFPRPHRLAFEESLGKIYQSMYLKATQDD